MVERGDLSGALAALDESGRVCAQDRSTLGYILVQLGDTYFSAGRNTKALSQYQAALSLGQRQESALVISGAHDGLAICLSELGRFREALDSIEAATRILSTASRGQPGSDLRPVARRAHFHVNSAFNLYQLGET